MAKKPEPPKPTRWNVYKIAVKAVWLGEVGGAGRSCRDGEGRRGIQGAG